MIITIVSVVVGIGMTITFLVWIYKCWKGRRETRKLKRNRREVELGEYERMEIEESKENKHSVHDETGLVEEDTSLFDKPLSKPKNVASRSKPSVKTAPASSSITTVSLKPVVPKRQSRPEMKVKPALPWISSSKKAPSSPNGRIVPANSASPGAVAAATAGAKDETEGEGKNKKGVKKAKAEFEDPGPILPYPSTYVPGFPSHRPWIFYAVNPEYSLHVLLHTTAMKSTDSSLIDLQALVHRSQSPSGSSSSAPNIGSHQAIPYLMRTSRPAIIPTLNDIARSLATLHNQGGKAIMDGTLSTHTVLYDDAGQLYLNIRKSGHLVGEWDTVGRDENRRWAAPEIVGLKYHIKRGKNKERGRTDERLAEKEEKKQFEAEEAKLVTTAVDVFAFGSVVWEMLTLQTPYDSLDVAGAVEAIKRGEPLSAEAAKTGAMLQGFDEEAATMLVELIEKCRAKEPAERPTMGAVLNMLLKVNRHIMPKVNKAKRRAARVRGVREAMGKSAAEGKKKKKQQNEKEEKNGVNDEEKDEKEQGKENEKIEKSVTSTGNDDDNDDDDSKEETEASDEASLIKGEE
ncbi:uncharacterized protein MONOS_9570 [Monocercomonoides exilis]|uniref:uncharacterized protein n=1 Tax=Monocercomonoides exilis TaxID=2049356 RepID=UPI00355A10C5|nr:hypothetical protein MONOS_9570 [Monocercomonoides exilis]|eukprot:MONOS_9570.1-p1 / transcript=MONOS_9570.1 / gene=MONOS_9570 / organism=Monocercomonoides_exilis_PA203 / gene_product=unspecified product / transcript_product=unspecified product / location=Mono_scaffold00400:10853-12574(+) / protein_length=573 / sequence_SO=supercontig / SO=protein_coding / is_pseudo=false